MRRASGKETRVQPALTSALALMDAVAKFTIDEAKHLRKELREEVQFLAADALKNELAVKNLAKMGRAGKAMYVSYGTKLALGSLLPGREGACAWSADAGAKGERRESEGDQQGRILALSLVLEVAGRHVRAAGRNVALPEGGDVHLERGAARGALVHPAAASGTR